MRAFNKINKKHILIKSKLELQRNKLNGKKQLTNAAKKVGDILDISKITVINYANGDINDGYLAEAILTELKKIK